MAYTISYSNESSQRYPMIDQKKRTGAGKWILLILVVCAGILMRIKGVPDFLIPGEPEVTKTAAISMVSSIQSGTPVMDAVTVFCHEILNGSY